jgi:hypothetical protein
MLESCEDPLRRVQNLAKQGVPCRSQRLRELPWLEVSYPLEKIKYKDDPHERAKLYYDIRITDYGRFPRIMQQERISLPSLEELQPLATSLRRHEWGIAGGDGTCGTCNVYMTPAQLANVFTRPAS